MPIVQIEMFEGRTIEQKRKMADKVTAALVETLDCPKEAVTLIIREIKGEHYAEGGLLFIDTK